jgi:hypothetical protein
MSGVLCAGAAPAHAIVISSSGQTLEKIWAGSRLKCQVKRAGAAWTQKAFEAGGGPQGNGKCGTFMATKKTAQTFGPNISGVSWAPAPTPGAYLPVGSPNQSYTNISGNKCVRTDVQAGPGNNNNSFLVTQYDCYNPPANFYTTTIVVSSLNTVSRSIGVYHGGVCHVRNSPIGYGFVAGGKNIFCTKVSGGAPSGWSMGFIPSASTPTMYREGLPGNFWRRINWPPYFDNTCACGTVVHNAAGLWSEFTIGPMNTAGGTVVGSFKTRF